MSQQIHFKDFDRYNMNVSENWQVINVETVRVRDENCEFYRVWYFDKTEQKHESREQTKYHDLIRFSSDKKQAYCIYCKKNVTPQHQGVFENSVFFCPNRKINKLN